MSSDSESAAEEAAMAPDRANGGSEGFNPVGSQKPADEEHISWYRKSKVSGAVLSPFQRLFRENARVVQTQFSEGKKARAVPSYKPLTARAVPSYKPPTARAGPSEKNPDCSAHGTGSPQDAHDQGGDGSVLATDSETDEENMFPPNHFRPWSQWTPTPRVAKYLAKRLRRPLRPAVRQRLRREYPRPIVQDRVAATPALDPKLFRYTKYVLKKPQNWLDGAWIACQWKLLDITGPLAKIFEMAETAKEAGTLVDPTVLSRLAQGAICLLGDANCAVSAERRKSVLMKLDHKWMSLSLLEAGPEANGLLFGDPFVKELENLIEAVIAADEQQMPVNTISPTRAVDRGGRKRLKGFLRYQEFQDSKHSSYNTSFPSRGRGGSRGRPYKGRIRAGNDQGLTRKKAFKKT